MYKRQVYNRALLAGLTDYVPGLFKHVYTLSLIPISKRETRPENDCQRTGNERNPQRHRMEDTPFANRGRLGQSARQQFLLQYKHSF